MESQLTLFLVTKDQEASGCPASPSKDAQFKVVDCILLDEEIEDVGWGEGGLLIFFRDKCH